MTRDFVKNRVLLTLVILIIAAGSGLAFLSHAPNRLVSGEGISLASLLDGRSLWLLLPVVLLLLLSFLTPSRRNMIVVMLLAEILLFGLTALTGHAAIGLTGGDEDSVARTSLGGAFWASAALSLLIASDAISRITKNPTWRILLNVQVVIPVIALIVTGQLSELSLLKEYDNRSDVFNDALWQHLGILFGTLVPAILLGLPLGIICHRSARWQTPILSVLNIIQTVPSIALFGLLLAPLAGLAKALPWLAEHGISGIGLAPAIIALVLYSLLPLVRSVIAGLDSVSSGVIESARGMGMNRLQVFYKVQIPIALPVILTGIRIVAVQTVGMAVVAALIGAGGFGAIMFQGLLSSALDLVLLGVIPVVLMAVIVDGIFKFLVSMLETSRR
ncbi:ABC transporter permease [Ewingella americana]|uniref:Permease component of an ABC superfamily osmoprotectant transporter n=2 Tax=Ewingella americana TaxID=41202 RepID=A0A085GKP6_EWIA3|nr:ABC transporter permease [Ewingella americana]KAA8729044.1 ABC transporter permease [Ewingella americana]KFC84291.1 permease component of an ABC superfamily osmoprotectant transporter [Ewingella americana ATCC 33852]STQ45609.1 Putative osmoprotectant uptake system permease protein yehY [Ewingella americana]